ncbi:N-acylneuraminate cytidylyltransferase [Lewinella aquimaris]|uniref:N-acylneuraminate cytidylyltransferase n=1 Tax=Neolewinella aquimaris TaxID=1835722 RepID=A0A840E586_9BACT|nr:NTP transferase domain-containing protein [Neolewinella aquimaris]MBB4080230.1 N-acylneuraminate cytidylyltransferase [Neolewinella aquimaris]
MNVAIVTARAGSKSILNKNVYDVLGKPMVYYPIKAAQDAIKIDAVFVSTDGKEIAEASRALGATVIERPDELGGDHINHGDVIKHATQWVDANVENLENVVLLLGNTVMIDGPTIDTALQLLDDHPELDSCMTVWEAADDHPLRAMEITQDGLLEPYGDKERKVSTERQSYQKAYYYDQGVWVYRKYTVNAQDGPNPWWWMGKKSAPIIRPWVTGRDVHTLFDMGVAEWWVKHPEEVADRLSKSKPVLPESLDRYKK